MPEVRGLLLAAGLGVRLRPLSDYVPKPLLPVAGTTLLDRAIETLDQAGVGRIAVNAHHRADRIATHLKERSDAARFHLSMEQQILGTGGALHGVRTFLAKAPTFIVHNADVLSDLDCKALLAAHRAGQGRSRRRPLATLGLVDWPAVNSVLLAADGRVRDISGCLDAARKPEAGDLALTFSGIACYDCAFLDHVPAGHGSIIDVLVRILRDRPDAVRGFLHTGYWQDLGTLSRYLDAHRRFLGPGFVSIEGRARVPSEARLAECVVLDGAVVPPEADLRRAVVGRSWVVREQDNAVPDLALAAAAGFDLDGGAALQWIDGNGSERRFVRLVQDERRAVLMLQAPGDPDTARTLAIATFLYDFGLGAPAVLAHDPVTGSILFEDLGENTLNILLARTPSRARDLYERVLNRLADLQTFGAESRARCPLAWDRSFDGAYLRWETDYFRERFLIGHAGLCAVELADLDVEFDALAAACRRQPYTLVHRDFQSQNIHLKDDAVRLVDVQGMRWGPVAYDVVSLLFDPYVDVLWTLRRELLTSFPSMLAARGGLLIEGADWQAMSAAAVLQRLMQALGAFSYLGHIKGKTVFLSHIPAALHVLRRLLQDAPWKTASPYGPPPMPRLTDTLDSIV